MSLWNVGILELVNRIAFFHVWGPREGGGGWEGPLDWGWLFEKCA